MSKTASIRFRLIRNHAFNFGDSLVQIQPASKFVAQPVRVGNTMKEAVVAIFDVGPKSRIQEIELLPESVVLPDDYATLAPDLQKAVRADAVTIALENRKRNLTVRDAVRHYVEQGALQMVDAEAA